MNDWITPSTLRQMGLGKVVFTLNSRDPDLMQSVEADTQRVIKAVGVLCSLIEQVERKAPELLNADDAELLVWLARDVTGVCSDAVEGADAVLHEESREKCGDEK